ncbi:MAG: NADH-quinone oxidoreductase subunit F, partial [Planctomycetes bacterium]|nr:NADH-quinone oxidoreductase subunit F [Planctomycetota bacterium]
MPGGPRVFYGNVSAEDVDEIIASHVVGGTPVQSRTLGQLGRADGAPPGGESEIPDLDRHPMRAWETRIALRNAGTIDPADVYQYLANGGYRALNHALTEMTAADTLEEVNKSGLRGRGGAAFPTSTKWKFLAGSNAPDKYILCNCEEGDPGAFNDKAILESDP